MDIFGHRQWKAVSDTVDNGVVVPGVVLVIVIYTIALLPIIFPRSDELGKGTAVTAEARSEAMDVPR